MNLRPYQIAALHRVREAVRSGHRRIAMISPTGSGKTVMFSSVIRDAYARGNPCLVMAHRGELIDQTVEKLAAFDVPCGVIMGSDHRTDSTWPVQVATTQTLHRRMARRPPARVIVYDEAHHALAKSNKEILDAYPDAIVLGVTATPWRQGRLKLDTLFTASVLVATPAELMQQGYLCGYEAFAYAAPDTSHVRTVAGEFHQGELDAVCRDSAIIGNIVTEYATHARGRKAIVFPASVAHSRELVAAFRAVGINAAHLDANTPRSERREIIEKYRAGWIAALSSVAVLSEGFDVPDAEVCILARPTKSLGLHMQCIGRVLRPAQGKVRALIHDHGENLIRNGLPDEERDWSLGATSQLSIAKCRCTKCGYVCPSWTADGKCSKCGEQMVSMRCSACGKLKPRAAKFLGDADPCRCVAPADRSGPDQIEDSVRIALEEIRARRIAAGFAAEKLTLEDIRRIKDASSEDKAAEFKRLLAVTESKGYQRGWASHQYRAIFGVWPRFGEGVLDSVPAAREPFIPLARLRS